EVDEIFTVRENRLSTDGYFILDKERGKLKETETSTFAKNQVNQQSSNSKTIPKNLSYYMHMNSQLRGVDHGRLTTKCRLERELDQAVRNGDLDMASKISDQIAQRNCDNMIREAIERKEFHEKKMMVTILLRCGRMAYTCVATRNGNLRKQNTKSVILFGPTEIRLNWHIKFNLFKGYRLDFYSDHSSSKSGELTTSRRGASVSNGTSGESYERRFRLHALEKDLEAAITIYIRGLLRGLQFSQGFHSNVRRIITDARDPYLTLRLYNDLLNARIKFGESADWDAAKIDNALKSFSPYKVNLAYQTLRKKSKVHNLIYREVVDRLAAEFRLVQQAMNCYRDMRSEGYSLDLWTYNRLLNSVCRSDDYDTAWRIIEEMVRIGVKPDIVTFNILLNYQIMRKRWDQVVRILDMIQEARLFPSESTYHTLTNNRYLSRLNYREARDFAEAIIRRTSLFRQLEWFANRGDLRMMIKVYEEMIENGMNRELRTFEIIVRYFFSRQEGERVKWIYGEMVRMGIKPNSRFYGILIKGFVKMNDMKNASVLYRVMTSEPMTGDIDTYNYLLWGHAKNFNLEGIIGLLDDMLALKVSPNINTISIMMNLFIKLKNVGVARQIFDMLVTEKYVKPNLYVFNSLVFGYTHIANDPTEATRFLLHNSIPREIQLKAWTFNIVIKALISQDNMNAAMNLMRQMEPVHGVEPNGWTFYHMIIGYIRRRRFDQALELLNEMSERGMEPSRKLNNFINKTRYRLSLGLSPAFNHSSENNKLVVKKKR
ncbi:354_t:CDS:2, partial [Acaulospora colombiana]